MKTGETYQLKYYASVYGGSWYLDCGDGDWVFQSDTLEELQAKINQYWAGKL